MNGWEALADILRREGVDYLFCFPSNPLIDVAARAGIRPILARTERTVVGMADGYSRYTNGERIGVCCVQAGPGTENMYAGVAQAYGDSVPILVLPGQTGRNRLAMHPNFEALPNYGGVTKWLAQINLVDRNSRVDAPRVHAPPLRAAQPGATRDGARRDGRGVRRGAVRLSAGTGRPVGGPIPTTWLLRWRRYWPPRSRCCTWGRGCIGHRRGRSCASLRNWCRYPS